MIVHGGNQHSLQVQDFSNFLDFNDDKSDVLFYLTVKYFLKHQKIVKYFRLYFCHA